MNGARGRLVLVPNALDLHSDDEVDLREVLPHAVLARAAQLSHWAVENAKSARAFLKRVDRHVPLARPLQALDIRELPRPRKGAHDVESVAPEPTKGRSRVDSPGHALELLLAPAWAGEDIGLLSEAGLPAVADPGAALVAVAHTLGIAVEPLPGPSSLMLALAASGLNGQSFAFVGYLPVDAAARAGRIRELEQVSRRELQTQIAIETPYRNATLLRALAEHLHPETRLSIACGLTLPQWSCRTLPVREWRRQPLAIGERVPAVFLWLAG
jgi:16S rRNA (cytidine1402-2'-O)-methyltransferase